MFKRTLARYLAVQFPGWLIAAGIALALRSLWDWPMWLTVGLVLAWIAKDFALYPLLRRSYEIDPRGGASAKLIGARGIVTQDLDPDGWIHVDGALWQARPAERGERVERGRRVRVESVEGLRLLVRSEETPL